MKSTAKLSRFIEFTQQLTKNPKKAQIERGWTLMDILTTTFPPSKNLENYLKNFILQHLNIEDASEKLKITIKHSSVGLLKVCKAGPRGRTMNIAELQHTIV